MASSRVSLPKYFMGLAKMILHSRGMRRKILFNLIIVLLVVVALGTWPLSSWLGENIWLFLIWWAGCFFYAIMIILLALYDILSVFKEERHKLDN
ncbi:MAG: hypothetical protein ACSHX0_11050 [Akkermansiaceae bacterium]